MATVKTRTHTPLSDGDTRGLSAAADLPHLTAALLKDFSEPPMHHTKDTDECNTHTHTHTQTHTNTHTHTHTHTHTCTDAHTHTHTHMHTHTHTHTHTSL